MKAELKLKPHSFGTMNAAAAPQVVEVWFGGVMVGTVYGADGPGIRFISKHQTESRAEDTRGTGLHAVVVLTKRPK